MLKKQAKGGLFVADDCIFCKIAAGQIPVKPVYEDEKVLAFPDINPVAPVHVLVIPRRHIESLQAVTDADKDLMAHVCGIMPKLSKTLGVDESGFRVVTNIGKHGGQSVPHLHFHLLGGRSMEWPPG
jgi:histidine triad (HIT) family protein